jgi:DNA-binding transcriptional ArsR family regulator
MFGEIQPIEQPALSSQALIEKLATQLMGNVLISTSYSLERATKALQVRLKEHPHLIIIDNLETVLDVQALLPTLRRFAAPTKILFTTRKSLFAEAGIYRYVAEELSEANALQLVREGARLGNLMELAQASDEDLKPIYETVGGNPLALWLIVGQTHVHSLDLILTNLVQARGQTVKELYTYIYRQAWDSLDEVTRRLFLVMPLIPAIGGDFQHLQMTSGLTGGQISYALKLLVNRNLVDVRGDFKKRRYTIHNLTRTFLHERIVNW